MSYVDPSHPSHLPQVAYQVWARALWAALDVAHLAGIPTDQVCVGLPFDARSLRRRRSIDWDDFCVACERLELLSGSPEACQQLLASSYHRVLPELRALIGGMVSPLTFAQFSLGWLSPMVYEGCDFRVTVLDKDQIHVELTLRPNARPSLTFFRATVGELRALPRHLGLPPAEVSAEFNDSHGSYRVHLPPSSCVTDRVLGAAVELASAFGRLSGEAAASSYVDDRGAADSAYRLHTASQVWGLTRRQQAVLEPLVQGASNKEIAQQLGCAENTVELHVGKLLAKAHVPSRTRLIALFWRQC